MSTAQIERIVSLCNSKRLAIAWARAEANYLIEQLERQEKGYDKGIYRDDDALRSETKHQRMTFASLLSFALSEKYS